MIDELKEKIKIGIRNEYGSRLCGIRWMQRQCERGMSCACLDTAKAALDAIESAGYVIVPREPTDRMIWAGGAALHDRDEDADGVWTAMITVDPAL